ncbi:MAG TPA: DNA recombination protein RmuC [Flavobacteriales bacterium]|nr:DNA recombination protein RmuC [Flavobacteriales bacterium]
MGLIIGLLIGIAIGWFIASRKGDGAAQAVEMARVAHAEEKASLQQQLAQAQLRADGYARESSEAKAQLAAEQERSRALATRLEEQKEELERMQARMTTEFENIANRLLALRGKELNEQQQERLTGILKPLQERIKDFEEKVQKAYDEEGRQRFALKSEVARLVEQNQKLSQEAHDLTRALKGDSQAQGAWGEMILERLLEGSGLIKGQEYSMQESTTMADGSRLRPDAVVMLPEGKHLIIDSKVSLLHYERYAAASDDSERERMMKLFVESIRAHARGLGEKDYTKLYGVQSVDFVLMFVPIEPAFLLALREKPEVFQEAYDRQVVMVTHTTLMATLRTIHGIWKNERIARHHLEIAERAGRLYDKFEGFTVDLGRIGKSVKEANENYEKALSKLSDGPGSLVRQVELIKALGAKTNKSLNEKLLARSIEEAP